MQEALEGTVERITYLNEETGYSVLRLTAQGHREPVTVVGNLASVNAGESLRLSGFWTSHPQYGRQFRVLDYRTVLPATVEGIRRYLGSGLIKGIGPITARRIVDHFGPRTLEAIDREPERLLEVPGVGAKRSGLIARAWQEQQEIKEVMLFLESHRVSTALAVKIYKAYGHQAVAVVRDDPYRLAREVYGIGFLTADRIARDLGIASDDPKRVQAGISYVLSGLADEGHVYVPWDELVAKSAEILDAPPDLVGTSIESLSARGEVHREAIRYPSLEEPGAQPSVREEQAVYLPAFYTGEVSVAQQVQRLIQSPSSRLADLRDAGWDRLWVLSQGASAVALNQDQRLAVQAALTHKVAVLTGGPGTGKTTTVRTIIHILEGHGHSYALAAPTGRAAKRLAEAAGRTARTIHRLLEFAPGAGYAFQRNDDRPLEADMVIVDEASMLELLLAHHLLKAIQPSSHLLLVGDVDQLPSVGPGTVLKDVIRSGVAAVVQLKEIFRQAEGSWIVHNAHRLNQGRMPIFAKGARDFFLFVAEAPEAAAERVVDLVQHRIPDRFGYDPLRDIQVLSPMYRGPAGVSALNARLQEALNPEAPQKPERRLGGRVFRLGDKVMQARNNYDKEVFNGDIGQVVGLDVINQSMTVSIDDRPVDYDFSEADELVHAYAVSVHKSQGSEYPAVVIPLTTSHYILLQRNLLYTAVTRARELVVIVGSKRAIAIAVRNDKIAERHSALDVRLQQGTV